MDIQVSQGKEVDLGDLKEFGARFPGRFPESGMQMQYESQLRLEGGQTGPSVTTRHGIRGFIFFGPSKDRVVQVRRDGFGFSKLHPYESWEKLREEARELWAHYVECCRPTSVQRLAVRYINKLPLPEGQVELPEWVKVHPEIPDEFGPMEEFLVRFAMRHPVAKDHRAVTMLAAQPANEGLSVVFDIDVFSEVDLEPEANRVWTTLDDLREFKNDVFFGTITKAMEERLLR